MTLFCLSKRCKFGPICYYIFFTNKLAKLEDTQVEYITQKYTSDKYTFWKYTFRKYTFRKYTFRKYTFRKYTFRKYTFGKYTFGKYTFGKYIFGNYTFGKYTFRKNTSRKYTFHFSLCTLHFSRDQRLEIQKCDLRTYLLTDGLKRSISWHTQWWTRQWLYDQNPQ